MIEDKKRITLEFTVTERCNKNCRYCFQKFYDKNPFSTEEQERQLTLLDRFLKTYDSSKYLGVMIKFWGGEPFLNTDFMFRIIEISYKYNFVTYSLFSNGTADGWNDLFEQEWFRYVRKRFEVKLSYDGEPHHTMMRGKDGAKTLELWEKLMSRGVPVNLFSTITVENMKYLPQMWDWFYGLYEKHNRVVYMPTIDTTNSDPKYLNDLRNSLELMIEREYDFFLKHKRYLCKWFIYGVEKDNCSLDYQLTFHTDGRIYSCHGAPYSPYKENISFGLTKDVSDINSLLNTYDIKENQQCMDCIANYCFTCRVVQAKDMKNFDSYVSQFQECRTNDMNRCAYYKEIGKYCHKLWNSLADYNITNG